MEITAYKNKSHILLILTFNRSDLNILSKRCPFDANLIVLDSWLKDLSTYQISAEKSSYKKYMFFLRQPIKFISRHVLWRNKSNLLPKHPNRLENYSFVWKKSLFGQFNFSNFKVKAWRFYAMQDYFSFFLGK
jgi:hypothetical protein